MLHIRDCKCSLLVYACLSVIDVRLVSLSNESSPYRGLNTEPRSPYTIIYFNLSWCTAQKYVSLYEGLGNHIAITVRKG